MSQSSVKRFFSYVEIMTKITSVLTFAMTLAYLFYLGQPINVKLTILFFLAMFLFDLATTAINNYIDTKTNTQVLQFKRKSALFIIYVLCFLSGSLGLYLAYCTDVVVLLLGGICFLCGVAYTYGPIPISRQPLGELISGIFYGLIIPFLLLYINRPAGTYLDVTLTTEAVSVSVRFMPVIHLLLLSVAPVCTTANIMLANNICDVEKDVLVKRFTLPYYLGTKALKLFAFLYYAIYASVIVMVLIKVVHPFYILMLLTLIPVHKNIKVFLAKQEKESTFLCAIKNFIIIMSSNTLLFVICGLFN